jgi:hypothetical protein
VLTFEYIKCKHGIILPQYIFSTTGIRIRDRRMSSTDRVHSSDSASDKSSILSPSSGWCGRYGRSRHRYRKGLERGRGCRLQVPATSPRRWRQNGPLKRWYPTITLHGVRTQKTEDGGSMDLWNVGILPQHYTASEPRRPRLETSPPWKPQKSHAPFRLPSSNLLNTVRTLKESAQKAHNAV